MKNGFQCARWLTIISVAFVQVAVAIAAKSETKILIKEIRITGAEVVPVNDLQKIAAPFIGKELDLPDLRKVADAITEAYKERGYNLARAIVPEQDISTGSVEIRVLEARLGSLTVEGNQYYSTGLITGAFAGVMADKAINQSSLERALLLLGDQYSDIRATASLKAGADPGTTDIVIAAPDTLPINLTVDYNNYGIPTVSRHILGVELNVVDPWFGSHFSYRENTGFDPETTHSRRAGLDIPINKSGTRLGAYYINGNFAVGGDLAVVGLTGNQEGWGFSFTHPFRRTRFQQLWGELGFDLRDSKLVVGGDNVSLDRIRLLKFGLNYELADGTGRTFASAYLFQGLGTAFGGSPNNNPNSSRVGAGDDFTYATINLVRLQSITSFLRAIFKTSGQIASTPLASSEQFGIGGPDTVKGYQFKELVGDNAFNAGAELRVLPIPGEYNEVFQLSLGLDYGLVQQRKPQPGQEKHQSLLGYGPGVRVNWPFKIATRASGFFLRFDVGFPVSPSKSIDASKPVYYVQTTVRF